jgi:hypothetical protein
MTDEKEQPARPPNFRRLIVPMLQQIGDWRQTMTHGWKPPSARWFADPDGHERWHATPRKRSDIPASEFPENDPEALRRLIKFCRAIANRADQITELAEHRLDELAEQRRAQQAAQRHPESGVQGKP